MRTLGANARRLALATAACTVVLVAAGAVFAAATGRETQGSVASALFIGAALVIAFNALGESGSRDRGRRRQDRPHLPRSGIQPSGIVRLGACRRCADRARRPRPRRLATIDTPRRASTTTDAAPHELENTEPERRVAAAGGHEPEAHESHQVREVRPGDEVDRAHEPGDVYDADRLFAAHNRKATRFAFVAGCGSGPASAERAVARSLRD